jgi:hypothetical protein
LNQDLGILEFLSWLNDHALGLDEDLRFSGRVRWFLGADGWSPSEKSRSKQRRQGPSP